MSTFEDPYEDLLKKYRDFWEEIENHNARRAKEAQDSYFEEYYDRFTNFNTLEGLYKRLFGEDWRQYSSEPKWKLPSSLGCYSLLGIESDATKTEIKKAYRQLCLVHHPDKGGDPNKFIKITEAYEEAIRGL